MSDHVEQLLGAIDDRHTELVLPGILAAPDAGFDDVAISFIILSSTPRSLNLPEIAPAAAPTAAPRSGLRKMRPISMPQNPPPIAPADVRLTA